MAEEENLEAPLPPNDGRISPLVNAVFKTCADSGKQSHTHTSRPSHSVRLKVKMGWRVASVVWEECKLIVIWSNFVSRPHLVLLVGKH